MSYVEKKSDSTTIQEIQTTTSQTVTDSKDVANALNKYFTSIANELASEIENRNYNAHFMDYIKPVKSSFSIDLIDAQTAEKLFNTGNTQKALGLDGILNKILKISAPYIIKQLCDLFNLSIRTGIFPDDWKVAKVSPIFKSGIR